MRFLTWFFTLDHKRIGLIYTMLGIWGGFLGLSLSLLIRLNYLDPYYNVVSSEVYNHVITSHGITMIFFFLMPVLIGGFGNYLLPLLLGLPDLNLPRLNALSAWLLLPSSVCLGLSMVGGTGVGWTFYPPLSLSSFSSGGVDFLMFSLHLAGVSSIFGSLNFICTIVGAMTDVMTSRVSIIIWAYLFTSILLILSLPVLAAGITMLLFDRNFSSSFFDPLGGGDPVLFQHLFWCAVLSVWSVFLISGTCSYNLLGEISMGCFVFFSHSGKGYSLWIEVFGVLFLAFILCATGSGLLHTIFSESGSILGFVWLCV